MVYADQNSEHFFGNWAEIFREFGRLILAGFSKLPFLCGEKHNEEKQKMEKLHVFVFFGIWANKFQKCFVEQNPNRNVRTSIKISQGTNWGKTNFCGRNSFFFRLCAKFFQIFEKFFQVCSHFCILYFERKILQQISLYQKNWFGQ